MSEGFLIIFFEELMEDKVFKFEILLAQGKQIFWCVSKVSLVLFIIENIGQVGLCAWACKFSWQVCILEWFM